MKFNTKTIHGKQQHDPSTGAVMTPIYQTSTFAQSSPGVHKGYEYSRAANPTRTALENALAAIENGTHGFAFGSGLAATDGILKLLKAGDEVIAMDDLYGGSFRMFTRIYQNFGLKFSFVDMTRPENILAKITPQTKLIWVETPTNPLMKIVDIKLVCDLVKDKGIMVAVDNTFASPYLQNPLDLGADIVMHSATKYLGGHSDVVAGAVVVKDESLAEKIHFSLFAGGGILGPQDAYLILRGIKTLHVRMQRHCENGMKVAEFLKTHPKIGQLFFPGLIEHPNHEIAKKQMKGFGGMVSFNFKSGKKEDAFRFFERLKIFTLAESLGGVESLANHPASMTHASIPIEIRTEQGISDDLVRLSVGIEDADDLLADLEQSLD
ncbi:MAG: cystathionine gamma-synthase [Weeksellaceae bacterium]|jgi:cystathionine beta-lyase|nr:cystathionine gamma-synthase [Weeksellaceae bacterium]